MRKLIAITQLSLDGVMQSPGGKDEDPSNGFTQGGWFMKFSEPLVRAEINELIGRDFDLLLGRRTYQIWENFWPHHDDNPIGKAFNRATKHVATHTLTELAWAKSQRIGGDNIVSELRALKATPGPEIHLWGSSNLLQTLIAAHLIDEHRLWIAPVVLGHGKRLFETGLSPHDLILVECRSTPSGILINTYHPKR
ncbi:dihydrofolate reductase family protein [Oleiharenicola lentus]|uniref:dihydrofolate reductase family protein n=1 Tax=Oleiharenicola lentus TaxID=2508720 RepID=UPI003F66C882